MDRTERFYRIRQLIERHRVVPIERFLGELEISLATFKRDLEYLRSRLNIPIVWDREAAGYRFDPSARMQELPGLWFNAAEIHALLTMQHLLQNLEPGLLGPHIEPLLARLSAVIDSSDLPADAMQRRIRILHATRRALPLAHFQTAARALLERRRLRVEYYNRARDDCTGRELSPQRLVHYRDDWYLDAWCHLRGGIRSFAVDAVRAAEVLPGPACEIPETELDAVLASGYGIFGGRDTQWAVLRFTPLRARWVAQEQWHPQQRGRREDDGSYVLEIPFSDDRELLMDILRHGDEVEVLGPALLRERVRERLSAALRRYG